MEMEDREEIGCDQNDKIRNNDLIELQRNFVNGIRKSHCGETEKNQRNVAYICHGVWVKFAKSHQKSPSRRNNNVQSCSNTTRVRCNLENEKCNRSLENYSWTNRSGASGKTTSGGWILKLRYFVALVLLSIKIWFYAAVVFVLLYCVIVLHKPTQALVSTNTQDLIYPLMRSLRIFSVPYVKSFPVLTSLYEESCLISNPYFTMTDVDCWPCETSRSIVDLTGFSNFSAAYHGSGIPFIVKDAFHSKVSVDDILGVFCDNADVLSELSLNQKLRKLSRISHLSQSSSSKVAFDEENVHIQWKINRVSSARLLRKYFPKPYFIPNNTEVSVQHFLFVDQIRSPTYSLPITEFANVFVTQASGTRFIVLVPTEWCKQKCKVVSIVLQPQDVLFYNWMYWRPLSRLVESSRHNLSVTYIGSFY